MFTGKEKAVIAAILTVIIGIAGQVANLNIISGDAQHTLTVVIAVVTSLATTFGVYARTNTS